MLLSAAKRRRDSTITNVRLPISLSVIKTLNSAKSSFFIIHPSSFFSHPSSFFSHNSSFFIHPFFILQLLSFSACLHLFPIYTHSNNIWNSVVSEDIIQWHVMVDPTLISEGLQYAERNPPWFSFTFQLFHCIYDNCHFTFIQ